MQLSSNKRREQLVAGPYTRLLAEHERVIAHLYETFANTITGGATFWHAIALEELEHEQMILEIDEQLQKGQWAFRRPAFITTAIAESIEWVASQKKNVESRGISMREALKMALQLESGMMEAKFFHVLDQDAPEMMSVIEALGAYTKAHVKRLQLETKRLKWRILGKHVFHSRAAKSFKTQSRKELQSSVKTAQADMLGLLVSLEESASDLYSAYSRRIPESKKFWAKLAAEETEHAAMLRKLYGFLDRGQLFRNVKHFDRKSIEADIDFILKAEFDVHHGSLCRHKACNCALKIEEDMTEKGFYSTVESDAPEFQIIARRLVELTCEHILRLKEEVGRTIELGEDAAKELPRFSGGV
jgi:rubrerythrin